VVRLIVMLMFIHRNHRFIVIFWLKHTKHSGCLCNDLMTWHGFLRPIGDSVTLLESARHDIYSLCSQVHQFAFDIVFAPLKLHLANVPTMPVGFLQ